MQSLPLFNALGNETRQQLILLMMESDPKTVQQLSLALGLSRPAVSHHIKLLKDVGLLTEERKGMKRYYSPMVSMYIATLKDLIDAVDDLIKCNKGRCQ